MSIIDTKSGKALNIVDEIRKLETLNSELSALTSHIVSHYQPSEEKSIIDTSPPLKLVEIDLQRLVEMGYVCAENAKSNLAEQFRVIKRPLVNNIFGAASGGIKRANLILICSSIPGEGKTFVSINLALSIANEQNKNVLLIDADVEKPSVYKRLGVKTGLGLIEYLENPDIQFTDIVNKTNLPNLSLIPAGKRHRYSTELLASKRMQQFTEEISLRYKDRVVLFDSPPLLAATQAQVIAQLVGQVVFVVAADSTLQATIAEAAAQLKGCDVVLTLLNKSQNILGSYGYGYGKYGH